MNAARKYLLYSTVAGLFASSLVYNGSVNIQFFYLLMLANLFVMLLMRRLWIPVGLVALIAFLAASGCIGLVRGTDTVARIVKELSGIGISATYFCCFFRAIDFDMELCARLYARFAYWVAIVGFIWYVPDLLIYKNYRLHSVLHEPAMFALTCLPALYVYADGWFTRRTYGRELLVMSAAFLLCQSSTGFIGVLIGACIFGFRFRRVRLLVPFLVAAVAALLYYGSSDFAVRVEDSFSIARTDDVSNVNLSTYALYTNIYIMERVLALHPILGNGLGSHGLSYERYISGVQGIENYSSGISIGLNAEDASSLATRVLSDMGILGFALALGFIWRFRPAGHTSTDTLCRGICVYFAIALLREGTYFSNEEWFFIVFYAISRTAVKRHELLLQRKAIYSVMAA